MKKGLTEKRAIETDELERERRQNTAARSSEDGLEILVRKKNDR